MENYQMLMTDPSELSRTLKSIMPTHVAVAYLGGTWQEYLTDLDALEEIIVSPTLGSYPWALEELLIKAKQHGFQVYFSERLHAKLFIGESACLIGSPNLSQNGFGGGLNEAAVHLTGKKHTQDAVEVFKTLRAGAVENTDRQHQMIEQLKLKWRRARNSNIFPNEGGDEPERSLANWKQKERVILTWYYMDGETTPNEKNIEKEVPGYKKGHEDKYFRNFFDFAANDDIREGDWLLCWAIKSDGTLDRRKAYTPYWMQVNKVIFNGLIDDKNNYSLLAGELKFNDSNVVNKPFIIDSLVIELTQKLLLSDDYKFLKPNDDKTWRFKEVENENQRFFDHLQQAYRNEVS